MHSNKSLPMKIYPGFITSLQNSQKHKRTSSETANVNRSLQNLQWYEPPQYYGPVQFFSNTGLHGLQYLGQRERHLFERLFWFAAFASAMIFSTVLIWKMWDSYTSMPIITVFNPEDLKLNQIPFPSVTICSVNKIRNQIQEFYRVNAIRGARGELSNETMLQMLASVYDVFHICHATETFTDNFRNLTFFEPELQNAMKSHWGQYTHLMDTLGTLGNASQSCEDMILYCLWLDSVKNCTELFQRVETDYGFCCTFNMIPLSLLWTLRNDTSDDAERVNDWDEANINYDNILLEKPGFDRKYPHRQFVPGRSAGLSILLDPHMDDYFCTNTDSDGFVLGLNVPIDYPLLKDNGIAIRTSTESFVSVNPDITMSDESIKSFNLDKRRCYFEGEKTLKHYTKYTASNCMAECIAKATLRDCGCVRYYMPYDETLNETVCHPWHYNCTEKVLERILEGVLVSTCDECLPTCTDIRYNSETTSLRIWKQRILELIEQNVDKHPNYEDFKRRAKDVSIVHVYFNVDSVFPRLRKEMTTTVDLISDAGGLLGLCMGFSVLSLLEIIYHGTLRVFCNVYRKRWEDKKQSDITYSNDADQFEKNKPFIDDQGRMSKNGKGFMLPVYFRTSFDKDFKKAYYYT